MLLTDKTALVTGAGRGIGRGIALAFAQQGCDVGVLARTESEVSETARLVRESGRKAVVLLCDVSDPTQIRESVDTFLAESGRCDILVNNAGYADFRPFPQVDLCSWKRTLDINLTAPFLFIQALLPSMKERRAGRIINISSVAGLKPIAKQSAYCASKYGLNGLTKVLALELKEYGIGVHAICPGGVDTRLAAEAMPERDKTNWMTPEDIAHAALYLASLSPRATTDEMLVRRFQSVPV